MKAKTTQKAALLTLLLPIALALASSTARAHEGHEDSPAAATAAGAGPQRLPDGGVFVPKPAQRQMGLRTEAGSLQALPRAISLNGQVVMDPNAGGKVQPMQAGRLEPGPRGLPSLGQRVRRGELLAYVRPATGSLERAAQAAQLAELRAARGLAEQRLARLRELTDTVPRKEIEALEAERAGLDERMRALAGSLVEREALLAPADGVIAAAPAVAGQVLDARELVFEIVDPQRLRVEALAFDTALAAEVESASVALGESRLALRFVGAARSLRDQALPLQFAAEGSGLAALALGQPLAIVVQTRARVQGLAVPAAALQKNPANQAIVWVKAAPERFEPRVVSLQPLDGSRVAVTAGLKAGERIVVRGALLLNQIR